MPTPQQAADNLALLGRRLKTADKQLRKDLLKEIRESGKPTILNIKAGIPPSFPNRGGMSDRMRKTNIGVRTRLTSGVGVRIQATNMNVRSLRDIDETGTWRHPIFAGTTSRGNKREKGAISTSAERKSWKWVAQTYDPAKGFFSEPIEDDLPRFRKAVVKAIEETSKDVLRGVGN